MHTFSYLIKHAWLYIATSDLMIISVNPPVFVVSDTAAVNLHILCYELSSINTTHIYCLLISIVLTIVDRSIYTAILALWPPCSVKTRGRLY